jgi:hypothetical protein
MNELVQDFKTHPSIPGALLAAIAGDPQRRSTHPPGQPALLKCNKLQTLHVVGELQSASLMTEDEAARILSIDSQFVRSYRDLTLNFRD